ncbi:hypothetical protein PENSOL_c023G10428 [Penicillium solitum]|uniref:PiggyBac transposable element-derived protein domain-containing protein n=1 Tax=Penicillium solitum TaxID=60172 RepID=A0A1V6R0C3_9EURO|nr:uncharacterized protein PENSOL_c023G10428 [Penicillium solitum]OQD94930.1 hypothetical protein PENSOL_c023G10428 [Penicillium solitum]
MAKKKPTTATHKRKLDEITAELPTKEELSQQLRPLMPSSKPPRLYLPTGLDLESPYAIFNLFISEEIFEFISQSTNEYAQREVVKPSDFAITSTPTDATTTTTTPTTPRVWKDTTTAEIKVFFGILIYMGVHPEPLAEIPGRDDPKMNILQLVYRWMCDPGNGRWLMVLDNADDDSIFFSGNTSNERGPLVSFLPQAAHGSILITSRNGRAARNLVGNESHVITVQPMNEAESLALLRARIPAPKSGECGESGEDEKALVQALEYIPLATTQAGAYISNRLPLITVSAYLRLFHEALMSMFDRQGIPEDLVRDSDSDELDFYDALALLLSYSLIRLEVNERFWQAKSRRIMARAFPNGDFESWTQCRSLLAHAKSVLKSIYDVEDEDQLNVATLSSKCGWFLDLQGAYEEAEAMHRRALEGYKKVLGREHPDTLTSVDKLGLVLSRQGKFEEAEALHRRALEATEKVLRREHPNTLTNVGNLGKVLSKQGQYEEVEAMHRRALEAREKVLGCEHFRTATSLDVL